MKIIFCRWKSICEVGITNAFNRLGVNLITLDKDFESVDYDKDYLATLALLIKKNPDASCVFTINFQPIIARCCNLYKIPYLSWIVDCPSFQLYSKTIEYPTNRIFIFDRMQYEKFAPYNPDCIFHFPLGADVSTYDSIKLTDEDIKNYSCDVSFVGSLYTEKDKYNQVKDCLPPMMQGFVDGLISAQSNVYGYNFIEDSISDEWAKDFKKYVGWIPLAEDYVEDVKGIVADSYIGYKCTETERINTLTAVSNNFGTDLWTLSDASMIPNINVRGGADSDTMMPQIIKCSKINLNMTNRPIKTGLPLRIFDLMACGGFVISNFQSEIPEHFIPDEDIVLYDSVPDLLNKIDYYLSHDEERIAIAQNGYNKVKNLYSYDERLAQMLVDAGVLQL